MPLHDIFKITQASSQFLFYSVGGFVGCTPFIPQHGGQFIFNGSVPKQVVTVFIK